MVSGSATVATCSNPPSACTLESVAGGMACGAVYPLSPRPRSVGFQAARTHAYVPWVPLSKARHPSRILPPLGEFFSLAAPTARKIRGSSLGSACQLNNQGVPRERAGAPFSFVGIRGSQSFCVNGFRSVDVLPTRLPPSDAGRIRPGRGTLGADLKHILAIKS